MVLNLAAQQSPIPKDPDVVGWDATWALGGYKADSKVGPGLRPTKPKGGSLLTH